MQTTTNIKCYNCDNYFDTDDIFHYGYCPECRKTTDYKDHSKLMAMKITRTKLVHFTDLDGKNRYFLNVKLGNMIRQHEINSIEYFDLKSAEDKHYIESIDRLKSKYDL